MIFLIAVVVLAVLAVWVIIDLFQLDFSGILWKILIAVCLIIYVVAHYLHKIAI